MSSLFRGSALWCLIKVAAGATTISTSNWQGTLATGSGVLQSLKPATDTSFDFSPSDYFSKRNGVSNYHTGDLTFRWRQEGSSSWKEADSAAKRGTSPTTLSSSSAILSSSFNNVFTDAAEFLNITRDWIEQDGDLILRATLDNVGDSTVEIGAFGFPIEFNNIFTDRTADDTTSKCVLLDPYIGLDAGYVQVTRLTGTGPNMIITPATNASRFEAWRFIQESTSQQTAYQSQVYEGNYAWQTLTQAYADNEWSSTDPWNDPTSATLDPGDSTTFALRFAIASQVYDIESSVAAQDIPVAVGIPGYVIPRDLNAKLFLNSSRDVDSISVSPSGALTLSASSATNSDWKAYDVAASNSAFGRARVTIEYADGLTQTVHYTITESTFDSSDNLSSFLLSNQWYSDTSDVFGRAPSVISYDYEDDSQILQESRAWIAGISDEGGAGSFEAAAMKASVRPTAADISKLETMATTSIWGSLQVSEGDDQYGVHRSLFFYDPDEVPGFQYDSSINFGGTWNKADAYAFWRAYDYVHVTAIYYGLYRADRSVPGILTQQNRTWYLTQAAETILYATSTLSTGEPTTAYIDAGLMGETIWIGILEDLKAEGLTAEATRLESAMEARQSLWSSQSNPFGSEMAWDSTGQEGVYGWSRYFDDDNTMEKTLNSIRGYMPTVAHWGWNGNARRYWDFLYAGKLTRIERMIHHYGSGLNSLPLLEAYKYSQSPTSVASLYDLRVGYGGHMGPLSNINADGFAHMAFHSWPDTMKWDAYSGDYGPGYLGHITGAATFLVEHPDFGWIAMGGNVEVQSDSIQVVPKDSVRRRIYVAAMGLFVKFDGGLIENFSYDSGSETLTISLVQSDGSNIADTIMIFEDTLNKGVTLTTTGLDEDLGGYIVSVPSTVTFSL
jgi:hypothetical protein